MAKNSTHKVAPNMEKLVMSALIKTALENVDKNRLCDVVSTLEMGKLAYLLNIPMFEPMINEFIIISSTGNIGKISSVNKLNSTCSVIYCANAIKYFKTAELAEIYTSTGKVHNYDDWEYSSDSTHEHKGEHKFRYSADYLLTDIEPLNVPEQEFEDEIKVIESE